MPVGGAIGPTAARLFASRVGLRARGRWVSGGAKNESKPPPPGAPPPPGPSAAYDADGKPLPSIPDATTVFKLSNPELMLDPRKSASWAIVAGVVAFFSVYLTWTAYREGLLTDGGQRLAEAYAEERKQELEVQKVLPDGRLLMWDGSIRKPPPKS